MTGEPFVWGAGGRRMTSADIERQRLIAAQLSRPDYSPVQHWAQGLARVGQNIMGGLEERRADRASEANAADNSRVIEALMGGGTGATGGIGQMGTAATPSSAPMQDLTSALGSPPTDLTPVAAQSGAVAAPAGTPSATAGAINPAIIAALTSPYVSDEVRQLATLQYRAALRQPREPHYWETNNGSLGMVGQDGRPQILYQDPTPRTEWVRTQNPDGTITIVPVRQGGGAQPPTDPSYWSPVEDGGPQARPAAGF